MNAGMTIEVWKMQVVLRFSRCEWCLGYDMWICVTVAAQGRRDGVLVIHDSAHQRQDGSAEFADMNKRGERKEVTVKKGVRFSYMSCYS